MWFGLFWPSRTTDLAFSKKNSNVHVQLRVAPQTNPVFRMSTRTGRIALILSNSIWLKTLLSVHRERQDALCWNLVCSYGPASYAFHRCAMSGIHLQVLTWVPLWHTSGSTGRTRLKKGVLLDPLTMRCIQPWVKDIYTSAQVQLAYMQISVIHACCVHRTKGVLLLSGLSVHNTVKKWTSLC